MVFRGKPSKACERCRARRLKCDLRRGACGSCTRAQMPCSYREVQQLRLLNESQQSVAEKIFKNTPSYSPQYLPFSIAHCARDTFFTLYVASRCWDFLRRYSHPSDAPANLTLAIEAVSCAYLWHGNYSPTILAMAREKNDLALRMTNMALKSEMMTINTTLLTAILLDLFEKITECEQKSNNPRSSDCHVNGALALIKLRGLEQFQNPTELDILVRLSSHHTINCIASGSPIPEELYAIHTYIKSQPNSYDPSQGLSDLMLQFADLRSSIIRGTLSAEESIEASKSLDMAFDTITLKVLPVWTYTTTFVNVKSERILDLYFHTYPNHLACQALNILRVSRIFLNEHLIEYYSKFVSFTPKPTENQRYLEIIGTARDIIAVLVSEICASVPQYVDCHEAARQTTTGSVPEATYDSNSNSIEDRGPVCEEVGHTHMHAHQLNCYKLIFPLYVVAISKISPPDVKPWVIKQLYYISSHFYIRNAQVVARRLERGEEKGDPWAVFVMLGGYAFGG